MSRVTRIGGAGAVFSWMLVAAACHGGSGTKTAGGTDACQPLVTGHWVSAGALAKSRHQPSAAVLGDGRALVSGGMEPGGATRVASAEVYDPVANSWTEVGPMSVARLGHALVRLPDGSVLAVGGGIPAAERFDPRTGTWSAVSAPSGAARVGAGVFPMPDGRVAIVGGDQLVPGPSGDPFVQSVSSVLFLDPATGAWASGPEMDKPRQGGSAVALKDGTILVVGGSYLERPLVPWELFGDRPGPRTRKTEGVDVLGDGATSWRRGRWPRPWGGMGAQAVPLSIHEAFIVAGVGEGVGNRQAVVFDGRLTRWRRTAPMQVTRLGPLAVPWSECCVLVFGGAGPGDPAEVYSVREDKWVSVPAPPNAAATVALRMTDGSILALGDYYRPREVSRYVPGP